ncbi:MAG: cell division protein ZapA [Myxococcota bacterium]
MSQTTVIKLLGKEYRLKTDTDPQHLQEVAAYLDHRLLEARRSVPDSQDAVILAALNLASELLQVRSLPDAARARIQALIDLVDSV